MQSAVYILNLINNKIGSSTNDVITSFVSIVSWSRAGTVQASRTKKYAATAIIFPSTLHTNNILKWERQQLTFRVPGIHYPAPIEVTSSQTHNTLYAAELQQITMIVL